MVRIGNTVATSMNAYRMLREMRSRPMIQPNEFAHPRRSEMTKAETLQKLMGRLHEGEDPKEILFDLLLELAEWFKDE